MDELRTDLRFALRQLTRQPGFALVLVLTLALGIGANTAVFSVVHGVLLRSLPFPEPGRIFAVSTRFPTQDLLDFPASWPEYREYAEATTSFGGVAGWVPAARTLTGQGAAPERVEVGQATWELFPVLGVAAARGRVFGPDEDVAGSDDVVVLSDGLWRRRFASDPGIVGRTIQLDGDPRTVLGVMPPDFHFPAAETDAWIPMGIDPTAPPGRGNHFVRTVGRLAPEVSPEAAEGELESLVARWGGEWPQAAHGWHPEMHPAFVRSLHAQMVGDVARPLLVLMGAVGLVLLIACANVANLLLVKGEGRRRELAVRSSMGAGRRRLARQLLTESLVAAAVGGVLGIGLAWLGVEALLALAPEEVPRLEGIGLDPVVLAFSAGLTLLAGLAFGLAPIFQGSGLDIQGGLRDEGRGSTAGGGRIRIRQALVVGEMALALMLLIGAGLLTRSFRELRAENPGFRPEEVLTFRTSLSSVAHPEASDVTGFYGELVARLEDVPGVRYASLVRTAPLAGSLPPNDIQIEGRDVQHGDDAPFPNADIQVVGHRYFETMGTPVLTGRAFDATDREDSPVVAVVNETMARTFWPDGGALGARVKMYGVEEWAEIVGVVGDVRQVDMAEPPRGQLYLLHAQSPRSWFPIRGMTVLLRAEVEAGAVASAARGVVHGLDPTLPLYDVGSMGDAVARSTASERFLMLLQLTFALLALSLASVGIYGVLAYSVAQRTQEIGIRMALGAERGSILRLVVGQGMALVAVAVVLGVAGALAAGGLLRSLLYGVSATDPLTYGAVVAALAAVALAACVVPGVRAARLEPSRALRWG